jgi:hypothetical protein
VCWEGRRKEYILIWLGKAEAVGGISDPTLGKSRSVCCFRLLQLWRVVSLVLDAPVLSWLPLTLLREIQPWLPLTPFSHPWPSDPHLVASWIASQVSLASSSSTESWVSPKSSENREQEQGLPTLSFASSKLSQTIPSPLCWEGCTGGDWKFCSLGMETLVPPSCGPPQPWLHGRQLCTLVSKYTLLSREGREWEVTKLFWDNRYNWDYPRQASHVIIFSKGNFSWGSPSPSQEPTVFSVSSIPEQQENSYLVSYYRNNGDKVDGIEDYMRESSQSPWQGAHSGPVPLLSILPHWNSTVTSLFSEFKAKW